MIPRLSIAFLVASSFMVASVESGASNDYHDRHRRSVDSLPPPSSPPDFLKLEMLDKNLMAMSNLRGIQGQRRSDQPAVVVSGDTKPAAPASGAPDMLFQRSASAPAVAPSNPVAYSSVAPSSSSTQLPPIMTHATAPPSVNASEEAPKGCSHPRDLKCKGATVSVVK
jgi:hypothetical protein